MARVFCKNTGTFKEFQEGTMLLDIIGEFNFERPYEMVLAIALAVLALIAIFMIATGRIRPF